MTGRFSRGWWIRATDCAVAYEQVREIMRRDGPTQLAESQNTALEHARARIGSRGTIQSPEFDAAYIPSSGRGIDEIRRRRLFKPTEQGIAPAVYTTSTARDGDAAEFARINTKAVRTTYSFDRALADSQATDFQVRFETSTGVENGLEPRQSR